MAVVKKKRIRWTPATDLDIVAHRVMVAPEGTEITKDTEPAVDIPKTENEVILPDAFPAGTFFGDGNYYVGVCAIDDVGNTSDIVVITSPFDFIAPGAPTELIVENI